jgi:TetR/AcrR family transcriptional regulator, transcriptional repressor for nem operon
VSDDRTTRFTTKGLATRARIVDATAELMFEHGVAGTSVEDVRNAAAVSGSQMSHYFHNKGDLTREVIASRRNDVVAFHTRSHLGGLDSIKALSAWADACIADADVVYVRGGCVYGSLAGELLEADDDVLEALAVGYDEWLDLFITGLTAMRERGDLRPDADPRHLAVALVAAHQGGAMLTFATGSPEPIRAALHAAIDYVRSFAPAKPRTARRKPKP